MTGKSTPDGQINVFTSFYLPFLSTCPPPAFPTVPSINLFRSSIYLAHFMYAKNGPRKAVKNFIYIFRIEFSFMV